MEKAPYLGGFLFFGGVTEWLKVADEWAQSLKSVRSARYVCTGFLGSNPSTPVLTTAT